MKRFALFAAALLIFASIFAVSAQDEPITLRLASWQWEDPAYMPFWEGTTDAFMEANPNVTIERFAFPIDQLWGKINLEVAAGTPPELIEVTGFNVYEYMNLGVLAPLNDCFEGTDIVVVADCPNTSDLNAIIDRIREVPGTQATRSRLILKEHG